jgi:hypothetical protein
MKVICINDKNKPNDIPQSKWIEEGREYNVLKQIRCNTQGGLLGYELEEIDLTGCEPYLYFQASRFAPATLGTELILMQEECIV